MAQIHHKIHVVLDHHKRTVLADFWIPVEFFKQVRYTADQARVDPGTGFVQQHQCRLAHEGHGNIHQLLLAVTQFTGFFVGHVANTELVNQRVGPGSQARVSGCKQAAEHGAAMLLRGDDQVVAHTHLAKHLQRLERAPDPATVELQRAAVGDILAIELDAAAVRCDLAQHAVEQGGFARAVGADHAKYFTGHDFKRHTADRLNGTVGFFQAGHLQDRLAGAGQRGVAHAFAPLDVAAWAAAARSAESFLA
ncbi:hypothetical protein GALL_438140 [mine drainage metagenome]|uniref:Uncharacterized protein n=1 Tax=mine drainage metagenome TaxID=410659 RepID=A0A1J5PTR4_9ZZZZ